MNKNWQNAVLVLLVLQLLALLWIGFNAREISVNTADSNVLSGETH